jgi:hypothetical protein
VVRFSQLFYSLVESKFGFEAFPSLTEESIKKLKAFGANFETLAVEKTRKNILEKSNISKDERDDIETYFRCFPDFSVSIKQDSVDEQTRPVIEVTLKIQNISQPLV